MASNGAIDDGSQRAAVPQHGLNVVKLGGRSVETEAGRAQLAGRLAALINMVDDGRRGPQDAASIRAAGWKLVVVHGGGAQVTAALAASGIEARFVNGLRVTDEKVLEVAEPVFTHIGKTIAHALTRAGAPAIGLTGRDAGLVRGVVKDAALGRVGTVTSVDAETLRQLVANGLTPVVGPIAVEEAAGKAMLGGALNVNADEVASAVAKALGAKDLLLLTDVPAVRGADGEPIATLTPAQAKELIASGVASGGMIPKINGALEALASGVGRVRVMDEPGLSRLAAGEEAGTVFVNDH